MGKKIFIVLMGIALMSIPVFAQVEGTGQYFCTSDEFTAYVNSLKGQNTPQEINALLSYSCLHVQGTPNQYVGNQYAEGSICNFELDKTYRYQLGWYYGWAWYLQVIDDNTIECRSITYTEKNSGFPHDYVCTSDVYNYYPLGNIGYCFEKAKLVGSLPSCVSTWVCPDWSNVPCSDGVQKRGCWDSCNSRNYRLETKTCDSSDVCGDGICQPSETQSSCVRDCFSSTDSTGIGLNLAGVGGFCSTQFNILCNPIAVLILVIVAVFGIIYIIIKKRK